jgi:ribosome-associated translation inhibitor RaiA
VSGKAAVAGHSSEQQSAHEGEVSVQVDHYDVIGEEEDEHFNTVFQSVMANLESRIHKIFETTEPASSSASAEQPPAKRPKLTSKSEEEPPAKRRKSSRHDNE